MTPAVTRAVITICAGLALTPALAAAQPAAFEQFSARVNAYMEFRSDFTEMVPPLRVTPDAAILDAASDALAGALRAARPDAKQGDIFTRDIATAFRFRIQEVLWRMRYPPAALLEALAVDAPQRPALLAVNDRFDWSYGAMMPECVLGVLPELPRALQYRFVGADLVLVDVEARLIVDILPSVLIAD
jgi:hypothetical protein